MVDHAEHGLTQSVAHVGVLRGGARQVDLRDVVHGAAAARHREEASHVEHVAVGGVVVRILGETVVVGERAHVVEGRAVAAHALDGQPTDRGGAADAQTRHVRVGEVAQHLVLEAAAHKHLPIVLLDDAHVREQARCARRSAVGRHQRIRPALVDQVVHGQIHEFLAAGQDQAELAAHQHQLLFAQHTHRKHHAAQREVYVWCAHTNATKGAPLGHARQTAIQVAEHLGVVHAGEIDRGRRFILTAAAVAVASSTLRLGLAAPLPRLHEARHQPLLARQCGAIMRRQIEQFALGGGELR
mmetsp:Transcript_9667/g.24192  ORF Transcript_9667/g.24192 Transcript_9667/m.24192 type:complete len:299 (-) Transcript_9667:1142-2038(-)